MITRKLKVIRQPMWPLLYHWSSQSYPCPSLNSWPPLFERTRWHHTNYSTRHGPKRPCPSIPLALGLFDIMLNSAGHKINTLWNKPKSDQNKVFSGSALMQVTTTSMQHKLFLATCCPYYNGVDIVGNNSEEAVFQRKLKKHKHGEYILFLWWVLWGLGGLKNYPLKVFHSGWHTLNTTILRQMYQSETDMVQSPPAISNSKDWSKLRTLKHSQGGWWKAGCLLKELLVQYFPLGCHHMPKNPCLKGLMCSTVRLINQRAFSQDVWVNH